ncbi:MAG: efflux RND transporter periplasmic adaptor subunit, partial [Bacteroidota bacterium]|nr:efflux RND transporter periplasmic adaptor subunit [Bacteroidota bacterium]
KHLRDQEQQAEATYGTEMPRVADIILKTIASGSVQPRQEILIKPQVSGIVRRVLVEAGDAVEAGDVLAEVMIVPDVAALSNAESRLARAQITLDDAQLNHDRNADLLARGVLAPAEAQRTELALKQAREELYAAEDNLRIVQEGVTARGGGNASNTLVKATVSGMVLEVPIKKGNSVIEANNFNEGTTIASVADMADLQFVGKIDESEVEKLHEGMPIRLTIGAIEGSQIPATLEHIAPKGVAEGGAIQFEIKAAVILEQGQFLRAGYSATADVVLDERKQVLAVSEPEGWPLVVRSSLGRGHVFTVLSPWFGAEQLAPPALRLLDHVLAPIQPITLIEGTPSLYWTSTRMAKGRVAAIS